MNAKDAMEIIENMRRDVAYSQTAATLCGHAKGFLEAVEKMGPVVEALEKALEDFCSNRCPSTGEEGTSIPHSLEHLEMETILEFYRCEVLGEDEAKPNVLGVHSYERK